MSPRLPGRRGDGDEYRRLPLVFPGDEGETSRRRGLRTLFPLVSLSSPLVSPSERGRHGGDVSPPRRASESGRRVQLVCPCLPEPWDPSIDPSVLRVRGGGSRVPRFDRHSSLFAESGRDLVYGPSQCVRGAGGGRVPRPPRGLSKGCSVRGDGRGIQEGGSRWTPALVRRKKILS